MFGRPQCIVSLNVHESVSSTIHHNIEFVVIQFRIEESYRRLRKLIHTEKLSLLENKITKAKCTLFQFPLEILHLHEMLELTVRQMLMHMSIHPVKHPLDYILNEITSVSRSKASKMAMSEPKKYYTILVDVNFVTTQIELEKDGGGERKRRESVDSGDDKVSLRKGVAGVDSSSVSSDNDDERCVFCACRLLSTAEIVRLPCSHGLHERCRQRLGSERCPSKICRADHA